jgi:uncharacterized protein (TIGR03083 family)
MADSGAVYESGRKQLETFVRSLSDEDLHREVPATKGWTIKDIVGHLAGDAACVIEGDFPAEFFASFGEAEAVVSLNEWTDGHVTSRRGLALDQIFEEWDTSAAVLAPMMSGDKGWPEGIPWFADRVLLTDLGVHQQDIYGALGLTEDRDNALIRMGTAGYVATMGFRLPDAGLAPLAVEAGDSARVTGEGKPGATVKASRFEMFRAMSGRRSPEQIAAYDWTGDPEPYIPYFYPYGVRHDALVE